MPLRKQWYVAAARIHPSELPRCKDVGMLAPQPIAVNYFPPRAIDSPEVEVTYLIRARSDASGKLRAYLEREHQIQVYAVRASPAKAVA